LSAIISARYGGVRSLTQSTAPERNASTCMFGSSTEGDSIVRIARLSAFHQWVFASNRIVRLKRQSVSTNGPLQISTSGLVQPRWLSSRPVSGSGRSYCSTSGG